MHKTVTAGFLPNVCLPVSDCKKTKSAVIISNETSGTSRCSS